MAVLARNRNRLTVVAMTRNRMVVLTRTKKQTDSAGECQKQFKRQRLIQNW
jgi:hypothetical protein